MREELGASLFDNRGLEPYGRLMVLENGPLPDPSWDERRIVERVRHGSLKGLQDLHDMIRQLVDLYFGGRFEGPDHYDYVHDLYLVAVEAIGDGALHDFRQLDGFVRTVVRYQALTDCQRRSLGERDPGQRQEGERI